MDAKEQREIIRAIGAFADAHEGYTFIGLYMCAAGHYFCPEQDDYRPPCDNPNVRAYANFSRRVKVGDSYNYNNSVNVRAYAGTMEDAIRGVLAKLESGDVDWNPEPQK